MNLQELKKEMFDDISEWDVFESHSYRYSFSIKQMLDIINGDFDYELDFGLIISMREQIMDQYKEYTDNLSESDLFDLEQELDWRIEEQANWNFPFPSRIMVYDLELDKKFETEICAYDDSVEDLYEITDSYGIPRKIADEVFLNMGSGGEIRIGMEFTGQEYYDCHEPQEVEGELWLVVWNNYMGSGYGMETGVRGKIKVDHANAYIQVDYGKYSFVKNMM